MRYTGSVNAARVLDNWSTMLPKFVKVMPRDYKRVLAERKRRRRRGARFRSRLEDSDLGEPTGFRDMSRQPPPREATGERVKHYNEFVLHWTEDEARAQGARCMDCGIPFCHKGCPLGNVIPDFNDFVYRGQWERALATLHSTNNFPEFTGRICPAPCEASCTLSINTDPVTIEYIEKAIADRGWEEGWIKPQPPATRTGKKVAVVGSGPSGMAAAQQLNRAGHTVTVFERENYIGGLLRLGIPDFKLEKQLVERRVQQMRDEGIEFRTGVYVGRNYAVEDLKNDYDAVLLCIGSTVPRDLPVAGPRAQGHPLRDGLPDAAEQAALRRDASRKPSASRPRASA